MPGTSTHTCAKKEKVADQRPNPAFAATGNESVGKTTRKQFLTMFSIPRYPDPMCWSIPAIVILSEKLFDTRSDTVEERLKHARIVFLPANLLAFAIGRAPSHLLPRSPTFAESDTDLCRIGQYRRHLSRNSLARLFGATRQC